MQNWEQDATQGSSGPVLAAVDTKCHKCGGIGHYSNQCPSGGGGGKSKGKGKDKGKGKQPYQKGQWPGKGPGPKGGKGPKDGCWTCGGPHFGYERPNAGGKAGQKGGLKSLAEAYGRLGSLRTIGKSGLPEAWGEEEEQLVSLCPEAGIFEPAVPVPTPACQTQYHLARARRSQQKVLSRTNIATVVGRATNESMGPKGQSFNNKAKVASDVTTIAIRTPVAVSNRFKDLQVPEAAMFGEPLAEVAMLGEPLAEGRWSTHVSAAFQQLQVPSLQCSEQMAKSESQRNQRAKSYKRKQRFNCRCLVTWLIRIL